MSSDTSPKSGYQLEQPARPAGATGAPLRHPHRRHIKATPSWASVIGTTLRLWVRRHVLHVPDTGRIGTARRIGVAAVAVVVAVAVVIVVVFVLAAPQAHPHKLTPELTAAQKQVRRAAAEQAKANAAAAADWVAAEVSPQAVVGCDPTMCAAILAAGYGSGAHVVLQPGVTLPAAGAVIVATPAVRAQYRAQLGAAAPAVIAAFGAGSQAVQVRLVVPGGQAGYSQALSAAVGARRTAGLRLIAGGRVHPRPAARTELAAGLVDPRLLTVFAKLAAHYPVYIISFADAGPRADGSTPYRQAQIGGLSNAHGPGQLSELAAVEKLLQHLPSGYQPSLQAVVLPAGRYGLKIRFLAPSPQ